MNTSSTRSTITSRVSFPQPFARYCCHGKEPARPCDSRFLIGKRVLSTFHVTTRSCCSCELTHPTGRWSDGKRQSEPSFLLPVFLQNCGTLHSFRDSSAATS